MRRDADRKVVDLPRRALPADPPEKDRADALGLLAGIVIVAGLGALVLRSMDGATPPLESEQALPPVAIAGERAGPEIAVMPQDRAVGDNAAPLPDLIETVPLDLPDLYQGPAADSSPIYSLDPGATPSAPPPVAQQESEVPALIFDSGGGAKGGGAVVIEQPSRSAPVASAAPAGGNRQSTVAKGTLAPAVLETPIDTTAPGNVRAIVSTDLRSFDGKRVLLPRSSRLVGQYQAVTVNGTPRVYVVWTRLVRPDGSSTKMAGAAAPNEAEFMAAFRKASMVSVIGSGDARSGNAIRVRTGEPVRVVFARNVDLASAR